MPPRTSAPRRRSTSSRPTPSVVSHDSRKTVASHGSSITILWVLMVCMCTAVWLVLLVTMLRIDQIEAILNASLAQQAVTQQEILPVADSAVNGVAAVPLPVSSSVSASGLLDRGSLSADGTKYAGYDSVTKGKIGIGVELTATKQVKHIVIFDTRSEATGKGTPSEADLSVRWKDAKTVEYDLLVKKGSQWVKETQSVKIFF